MKKLILIITSTLTLTCSAQENPVVITEDSIIVKSKPIGLSENWDFSNITFSNYPNTNDSDLVRLIDPVPFYANQVFSGIGDSVTQSLPVRNFSQQNITLTRSGKYTAIYQGQGTVKVPGQTYTNAEKVKIIEEYNLQFSDDSIPLATYYNIYYTFFNKTTRNHLISVFDKNRKLKGGLGDNIIGIGYSVVGGNSSNFTQANIQMSISPNPANNVATLSYNLVNPANIKIELTNQIGTINDIIFNGNKSGGPQQKVFNLNQYQSGVYTVKLTVDGTIFSQALIIQ